MAIVRGAFVLLFMFDEAFVRFTICRHHSFSSYPSSDWWSCERSYLRPSVDWFYLNVHVFILVWAVTKAELNLYANL